MRFALINSGLGLLAAACELRKLHPGADLVIAMDPDGMPWGPRTPLDIAARSLALARAAATYRPDVIVMACNTGTVHALGALRAEFEPRIPVVGTVPAIKPAAAASGSVAIWATLGTTASAYQRQLIADCGGRASVTPVACPALASAIDAGDEAGMNAAITDAARHTPAGCTAIVLGCTEYELVEDEIAAAVPGVTLFGSATAVAAPAAPRPTAAGRSGPDGLATARRAPHPPAPRRAAPGPGGAAAVPRRKSPGSGVRGGGRGRGRGRGRRAAGPGRSCRTPDVGRHRRWPGGVGCCGFLAPGGRPRREPPAPAAPPPAPAT